MKSKLTHLLAAAAAVLCMASMPTHAANINTGGNACQGLTRDQPVAVDDIGIINTSTTDPALIACTVTRSPLPAGATSALFYVDGTLPTGGQAICSLTSYDYTSTLLAITTFTATGSTFDIPVILPAAQVTTWAYTMLNCRIPPRARILGVTSVQ